MEGWMDRCGSMRDGRLDGSMWEHEGWKVGWIDVGA